MREYLHQISEVSKAPDPGFLERESGIFFAKIWMNLLQKAGWTILQQNFWGNTKKDCDILQKRQYDYDVQKVLLEDWNI